MDKKEKQLIPPIDIIDIEIDNLLLQEAQELEDDNVDCGTWDEDLKILEQYGF